MTQRVWRLELPEKALYCQVELPSSYANFPPKVKTQFDESERMVAGEWLIHQLFKDGLIKEYDQEPFTWVRTEKAAGGTPSADSSIPPEGGDV